jgi:formylglycine-generating enzyme required for sulfatase activity
MVKARRVIRGGSWNNLDVFCRSASRFSFGPDSRMNDIGFRATQVSAE